MAERITMWNWSPQRADRMAINANAEELEVVETDLVTLKALVKRQSEELLYMRAMFMGLVDVLHGKVSFDDAELAQAVNAAWTELHAPPPRQPDASGGGDPYRGTVASPEPAPTPTPTPMLTCTRCGRSVPVARTTITLDGELCDACAG